MPDERGGGALCVCCAAKLVPEPDSDADPEGSGVLRQPACEPSANAANSSSSVSGGRYVAEGVYVGVQQGLTSQSSKVVVEVEVRRHVTVETDLGQTGGSGLGLNYKFDY